MTEQELTERVIKIVTDAQKLPAGTVTAASTFEELGIDSLDGIQLLFAFEEEFRLTIPEQAAQQMKSVPQVVAALGEQLAKLESAAASS